MSVIQLQNLTDLLMFLNSLKKIEFLLINTQKECKKKLLLKQNLILFIGKLIHSCSEIIKEIQEIQFLTPSRKTIILKLKIEKISISYSNR